MSGIHVFCDNIIWAPEEWSLNKFVSHLLKLQINVLFYFWQATGNVCHDFRPKRNLVCLDDEVPEGAEIHIAEHHSDVAW